MRSKVSRFTLGVWGYGRVRSALRLRQQPFATVRNRMAVPMGSAAKAVNFGGFKRCVTSFRVARVAGVALCDIPTFFITCRKSFLCDRRNTLGSFSEDDFHFSWQAQHFGDFHVISRGRRSIWCRSVVCGIPFCVAGAVFGTLYTLHFTLSPPHSTLHTPHSTLYTLDSTLHAPQSTLHTVHFTLYTLHVTLRTLHFTLHTLHSTLYTPYSTLYTLHSKLYTPQSTPYT